MCIGRIVCLGAAAVLTLSAQDRAGHQIFRIPQGWNRIDSPANTILSPANEPKNFVVLMLSGFPLRNEFRATFDENVKGMNGTLRVVKAGEVQSRHTPENVDLLATVVELEGPNRLRSARYYMAASVNGRFELMVFMTATTALFERYWPAVQTFVGSWTFDSLTSSPENPPKTATADITPPAGTRGNRLEGVYAGYKYIYVTVLGAVQKKAVNDYFSFFSDGSVYWGFPQTGLAGFNLQRACQGKVEFCGTYQLNGEQVTILLNRGTYRQAGTVAPGGLQIGDRPYKLQADPAKSTAHALEGEFGRADARPGEDLARRSIRFTRDGKFIDQGIVNVVTSSDISTGSPRFERQAGSGTYSLAPYTLILHYSDGYQRQLGIIAEAEEMEKPALSKLFVNTYTLVRRR